MESLAFKLKNPGDPYSFPPTLVLTDLINFGSEVQQHIAFFATQVYYSESKDSTFPVANSEAHAKQVLEIAKRLVSDGSINVENIELDEKLILRYDDITCIVYCFLHIFCMSYMGNVTICLI